MAQSTTTYWNALAAESRDRWTPVAGLDGMAEELMLSLDPVTGEYTRLIRFLPSAVLRIPRFLPLRPHHGRSV